MLPLFSFKSATLGQQNFGAKMTQQSVVRMVQSQPSEANTSFVRINADSVLSPIQGYRVEVKNLLRSVTLDDVYVSCSVRFTFLIEQIRLLTF